MSTRTPRPLVLCEGKDDTLVLRSLAEHHGLTHLEFRDYQGETKLAEFLSTLQATPEIARRAISKILVTRDADSDASAAWRSVASSIESVFGVKVSAPGEWASGRHGIPISAWIIPGAGKAGMIESLCLEAGGAAKPELKACLDTFSDCVQRQSGERLHEKAKFGIWTIIAQGPGSQKRLSLERAITYLDMPWEHQVFEDLALLLRSL